MQAMTQAERTNALIDRMAAEWREREAESKRLDDGIKAESLADPIDIRLRAIVANNDPVQERLHGMAGGMQMFANWLDAGWYKARAAEHILRLRQVRRWHRVHRGKDIDHKTYESLLGDAAHCRQRAAGTKPMPSMVVVGG